jgi:ADP-ribosylglycohydrolase
MTLNEQQLDRAIGSVLASAAGDALGSQYEFGPSLSDTQKITFGIGFFGHGLGEWTDDTSMAMPILLALADARNLLDSDTLAGIVAQWRNWSETAQDVGTQTRAVLQQLNQPFTEADARAAAAEVHERSGRSGGNGSLMRTGPVSLGFLKDGAEVQLVEAAGRIAQLTHWEQDNVDACVLWNLAIRHAIRTGELDVTAGLEWIACERRDRWRELIAEASTPGTHPRDFAEGTGWVVRAFQAALSAIMNSNDLVETLEATVRGGKDTDTVAAIAGQLAGAIYGASSVPAQWSELLHGYPELRATDLDRLVRQAAEQDQCAG